jgi:hypothetical protein
MSREPGGIYRNPMRGLGLACEVCCSPVYATESVCGVCYGHRDVWGNRLADVVAPLSYAGPLNPQAVEDLWTYKDGAEDGHRRASSQRLVALLTSSLAIHAGCFEARFPPVTAIATVPSGERGARPDGHPFDAIVRWPRPYRRVRLERIAAAQSREIDPENLRVDGDVVGEHILVMDDNWTSGASAQSVAIAVRAAGAHRVSVLPLMRSLASAWGPTEVFLRARPADERFDPAICPVTSGRCPEPF